MAKLWIEPAEISHQSVNPPTTETGEDLLTVVLSPNTPQVLYPQAQAVPFVLAPSENL